MGVGLFCFCVDEVVVGFGVDGWVDVLVVENVFVNYIGFFYDVGGGGVFEVVVGLGVVEVGLGECLVDEVV